MRTASNAAPATVFPNHGAPRTRILLIRSVTAGFFYSLLLVNTVLAFDFDDVALRARQLADAPYQKPAGNLPAELQNLSYDRYRDIRFKPEMSLWRGDGLLFETAFFHQGGNFEQAVKINEITGSAVKEISFDPGKFDYGANRFDPNRMRNLGFSGFRIHYPVNRQNYKDEVLAFLGASYFRALGKGQIYGASARGLAVDTALSSGEEFPRFVEFWLARPEPSARDLTIYGLLDSPRLSGAYRFILKPGIETVLEVRARIYPRESVGLLGFAPLTSMFLFGENQSPASEDYRPEVHDSDGLSIHSSSGEWIWRPLVNPKHLLVTSFAMTNPVGFGLMQRDRQFDHYEDLETHYQQRPSAWVETKGKWGAGRVELVQIPVPDETNDNVVAYWVAEQAPQAGEPREFEYRVLWQKDIETHPPDSWVVQSRRGPGYPRNLDQSFAFTVDFEGPALKKQPSNAAPDDVVSADANGQILEHNVYRNVVTGGWRVTLRVRRMDNSKPVELRCQLRGGNHTLSETWSYILPPD